MKDIDSSIIKMVQINLAKANDGIKNNKLVNPDKNKAFKKAQYLINQAQDLLLLARMGNFNSNYELNSSPIIIICE